VIHLRLPGTLRYRDLAVRVVAAACKLVGKDGDLQKPERAFDDEVVSAFSEAWNNIAIHSYHDQPLGEVQIEIEPDHDQIWIRIQDFGASFEPARVPAPDLEALPESGLGLYIMRSFMDDVTYQPGRPNVLTLTKRLPDRVRSAGRAAGVSRRGDRKK